jgi:hypothetical protein
VTLSVLQPNELSSTSDNLEKAPSIDSDVMPAMKHVIASSIDCLDIIVLLVLLLSGSFDPYMLARTFPAVQFSIFYALNSDSTLSVNVVAG